MDGLFFTVRVTKSELAVEAYHRISVFNRILHMLDQTSRLAYYNGLVLPYLDYADIVWGTSLG